MPKKVYDHFLSRDEQAERNNAHNKLSPEDQSWLQEKCENARNSTGYRFTGRASADNALRLYLIADRGFTLEQVLDLNDLPADQIKNYFEDFFNTYVDDKKTPAENLRRMGDLHRRAFQKICDYRFPDYSQVRKVEDFYAIQAFVSGVGSMATDYLQDVEQITQPELIQAYYDGAGGRPNIEKLHGHVNSFCTTFGLALPLMDHPEKLLAPDSKAQALRLCRNHLQKISGVKIGEIPRSFSYESAALHETLSDISKFPVYIDEEEIPTKGMKRYNQYLQGRRNDIPPRADLDADIVNMAKDMTDGDMGYIRDELNSRYPDHKIPDAENVLAPAYEDVPDLFQIPEEDQNKLQSLYHQTFRRPFTRGSIYLIYDLGSDEFDLIRLRGGESVRQLVDRKYPDADEKQKHRAMLMETMRHALTEGIRIRDIKRNAQGGIILDEGFSLARQTQPEIEAQELSAMEAGLSATREARAAMFLAPEGNAIPSVDTLSPEQLQSANAMFEQIYGSTLNSRNHQDYLQRNPEKQFVDFFRVGGVTLRNYLGENRVSALSAGNGEGLKAEILRMSTDPRIALSFTPISYDAENDTYHFRDPIHVIDEADKDHILATHSYLTNTEGYKTWASRRYGAEFVNALDERMLNDMYQQEFHRAAQEGMVPVERITSIEEIRAAADPRLPHSVTMGTIETLYGAEPKYVRDWSGVNDDHNAVYKNTEFLKYMNDLPRGSFSNRDFSLVAFLMAMSPEVITGDPMPEAGEDLINHEDKVRGKSTMWTYDICTHYPNPRERLGSDHFELAIRPARDTASRLIGEYEAGNPNKLAEIMADSLYDTVRSAYSMDSLDEANGTVALQLQILQETEKLLEKNPKLKDAVTAAMDPEIRQEMRALISLKEVMDESLLARARMEQADREGVPPTPEEQKKLDRKVNAFSSYVVRWKKATHDFDNSPEYKEVDDRISQDTMSRFMSNTQDEGPLKASIPLKMSYRRKHQRLPKDMMDNLMSEDRLAYGSSMEDTVKQLKDYYEKNLQDLHQARELVGDNMDFVGGLTPEKCMEAIRTKAFAEKHLNDMTSLVQGKLTHSMQTNIISRFNAKADENQWAKIKTVNDLSANSSPVKPDNEERFRTFFDIVLQEVRRNPYRIAGIDEDLKKIKHVGEKSLDELLVRPLENKVEAVRQTVRTNEDQQVREADLLMLDRVSNALAEIDGSVKNSLCTVNNYDYPMYLKDEGLKRQMEGYDPKTRKFPDFFRRKKLTDDLEVETISRENEQEFRDFLDHPPYMTRATREKAILQISTMEQKGMLSADAPLEEGTKVYSHKLSARKRQDLKAAVESKDLERIRTAEEEYRRAVESEKAIFREMNGFGKDAGIPGNLDTMRTGVVPAEFAFDVVSDSRMNGLYLVGVAAKKMDKSFVEFAENPGKCILGYMKKNLSTNGFDSLVPKGTNFFESMEVLYEKGESETKNDNIRTGAFGSHMSGDAFVERCIGGLYNLETDPEVRKALLRYQNKIGRIAESAVERETAYATSVYHILNPDSVVDDKTMDQFKEGMKMAFLEENGIQKKHLPLPLAGSLGLEKPKPENYSDMLKEKNLYAKLTSLYQKNRTSALASDMDAPKIVIQETMFDYLKAHPEDRDKKEYKALEKLALNADRDLNMTAPADEAEIAAQPKSVYLKWKDDFKNETRTMENNLRNADLELNRNIISIQNKMRTDISNKTKNYKEFWKDVDRLGDMIRERQQSLVEMWHKREVTGSYFKKRYTDLQKVLTNMDASPENPPKLIDTRDKAQQEKDLARINRRVNFNFGSGRFNSLDNFKNWKLEQPGVNAEELRNSTPDQWKQMYRDELAVAARQQDKNPVWLESMEAQAVERIAKLGRLKERQLRRAANGQLQNGQRQNGRNVQNQVGMNAQNQAGRNAEKSGNVNVPGQSGTGTVPEKKSVKGR